MRCVIDENIILGRGMFATIYHGTLNDEPIALKRSPPELLEQEAAFLRRCDHPNVVRFRGIYQANEERYLIMEIAQYGDIQQYLGHRRFDMDQKLSFVKQISSGLEYIHSLNILHKGITSTNILLRDWNNVVISDFGEAQNYAERLVTDHEIVHDRFYSFKSDVFLLALLASRIFMDRRDAVDADEIRMHINIFRPRWGYIILSSLDQDPQRRPTAGEFHRAFAEL